MIIQLGVSVPVNERHKNAKIVAKHYNLSVIALSIMIGKFNSAKEDTCYTSTIEVDLSANMIGCPLHDGMTTLIGASTFEPISKYLSLAEYDIYQTTCLINNISTGVPELGCTYYELHGASHKNNIDVVILDMTELHPQDNGEIAIKNGTVVVRHNEQSGNSEFFIVNRITGENLGMVKNSDKSLAAYRAIIELLPSNIKIDASLKIALMVAPTAPKAPIKARRVKKARVSKAKVKSPKVLKDLPAPVKPLKKVAKSTKKPTISSRVLDAIKSGCNNASAISVFTGLTPKQIYGAVARLRGTGALLNTSKSKKGTYTISKK